MTHTIGQVSAATGLSPSALRYYEDEGLLIRPVGRDGAGRRIYSDSDIAWLRTCIALRNTGMDIDNLRRYVTLARRGPDTVTERVDFLRAHADRVRTRIRSLTENLTLIEEKVDAYARRVATETPARADASWETERTHHRTATRTGETKEPPAPHP